MRTTMRFPDFILGTVHKVKGLEFDNVLITSDFMNIADSHDKWLMCGELSLGVLHPSSLRLSLLDFLFTGNLILCFPAEQEESPLVSGTCCTWRWLVPRPPWLSPAASAAFSPWPRSDDATPGTFEHLHLSSPPFEMSQQHPVRPCCFHASSVTTLLWFPDCVVSLASSSADRVSWICFSETAGCCSFEFHKHMKLISLTSHESL